MDKPSIKRRRIDAATALSKPFKSPLRRPAPTKIDDMPSKPVALEDTQILATPTLTVKSNSTSNSPDLATTLVPPKRKRVVRISSSFPLQSFQSTDPEILELQKQHREIQSKVDALITKLETANQAHNLETNPRYIEIPTLITKWRLASQDAADEVFVGAKERFDGMGGMAAWKERSKRDTTRWKEFDGENREREDVDEDEGDVDNYGTEDSSGWPLKKDDEESQDQEFTMEFMLKSLHVDPKLIGYDTKAQRWIKI
ncbi:hypothetical protein DTO013E5_3380 [Penicillium roqueforti]|uniref:Genomic scaffold, ProqFM164S03 n=1 Tax=Penicillium roqueforti (strain FM164) TaxID=1365484 RepID=W6QYS3_PENRF|nr:hypothetical protein CBS147337_2397 [Penicillium roqueforti]CDM34697.1 unnamed protein product [Penicillium roqueforti FM164]KAI2678201.1 hypothetical protein CBS147355_5202 [Penicillium roqueforti]KAI2704564.1 hypothetical protein CBS147372_3033 [Penicillium roqueforti]KAI2715488.1 hypothetical protein CBS147318_6088 [Penicillium roqueforti]